MPPGCNHLWRWFIELSRARGGSGFGPNPISYSEISAWMRLTGADPSAWEIDLLLALDGAYLKSVSDGGNAGEEG